MTDNIFSTRLYLLIPGDLPIQEQLDEVEKTKLYQAINQLLIALKETSHQAALAIINQELANLEIADVLTVEISSTETSLKVSEVEDFDNYFDVFHVKTNQPAICIVRSLIVAYKAFIELNQYCHNLNPVQIKLQKQGFEAYAYLQVRVFSLD
ncbi:MAG: hypothetical protein KME23_09500 [Goleter apudmare HA4340-LM2]|jgi:hypothetical protein|nr:hypothetical protein [Goleter apudmare HA4340-LM2]